MPGASWEIAPLDQAAPSPRGARRFGARKVRDHANEKNDRGGLTVAICVRDLPDSRICRERVTVLDSRLGRDEKDKARQLRIVDCPTCGLRRQVTYDDGPTKKRSVERQIPRSPLTPAQRAKEVKRVQDYRKRRRAASGGGAGA
jgi:hypothetical protein